MKIREAKTIAFGSTPPESLSQFYEAWQWLHDNKIQLSDADAGYLDKLICDGLVKPYEGYSYNG